MNWLERFEGDHGPNARFTTTVVDAEGSPVTSGVRLRAGSLLAGPYAEAGTPLFEAEMTHLGDGEWEWEPGEDDLKVGRWLLQVTHPDVASPSDSFGRLLVRPRLPVEEVGGE